MIVTNNGTMNYHVVHFGKVILVYAASLMLILDK